MGKYLLNVTYTHQGLKGVTAKGGSAREKAARDTSARSRGGRSTPSTSPSAKATWS